jgi:hypothetical protein
VERSALLEGRKRDRNLESVGALAGFDFSGEELAAIERHAVGSGVNLWAVSSGV